MRQLATLLLLAPVLAPVTLAQVSATSPKIFKNSFAPGANLLPAARTKGFIQTWYHGQNLPLGMVATQMGWRYDTSSSFTGVQTHMMEIVLDSTPVGNASLSTTFANNLSATPTTFLPLQQVNWPQPPSGGLDPAIWIPGAVPFTFTGPHLIVQVDVQTEATPRSLTALYTDAYSMLNPATPYLAQNTSGGCAPSSLTAAAVLNGVNVDVSFTLSGGPANSQAVYLLSGENQAFAGINVLPLDLGFLGMTGCTLGVNPIVFLSVPTNGAGGAVVQGPVPNTLGISQNLFAQVVHSGGTPAGLVSTSVAGAEVGEQGLTNYLYNWDIFGPTAQFGPYPSNRGAVILLR